jgi:predicted PurR-regulated permease PerM
MAEEKGAHDDHREVVIAPRSLFILVAIFFGSVPLLATIYTAREILAELCAAIIFAMALEPIVQALQGRGLSRCRAVSLTFTVANLAMIVFVCVLFPSLVEELGSFARHLPELVAKLTSDTGWFGFLEHRFHVVEKTREWIETRGLAEFGRPTLQVAGGLVRGGTAVVTAMFLTLYVSLDGRRWWDGFLEIVPGGSRSRWERVGRGVSKAVGGYVFGNLLISAVAGVFATVVLLVTRVPYPVPLGLLVALIDLIPLVGASLGAIVIAIVAFTTKGVASAVIVLVAMRIYQEIENRTLTQLIYHRTVNLSALAIALSVSAGAELGGIAGVLFAIPVAGAIKVVVRELIALRRGKDPPEEPAPPEPRHWVAPWGRRTDAAAQIGSHTRR